MEFTPKAVEMMPHFRGKLGNTEANVCRENDRPPPPGHALTEAEIVLLDGIAQLRMGRWLLGCQLGRMLSSNAMLSRWDTEGDGERLARPVTNMPDKEAIMLTATRAFTQKNEYLGIAGDT